MRGFLRDIFLRPSCYACPAKSLKSGADITLGDWWGIDSLMPEIDDDRGVSAVTVNTNCGKNAFSSLGIRLYTLYYEGLTKNNSALIKSAAVPENRSVFFKEDGQTFEEKISKLTRTPLSCRVLASCLIHKLLPEKVLICVKNVL